MRIRWAQRLAERVGPRLVEWLAGSWRFRLHGREHYDRLLTERRPFIFVLWHSRILPLLYLHRREDVVLLISRHRDGSYLADLADRWGYRAVRGSTKRGGEVGLLGIVRALQEGASVALTPDGPRGPAERVKPGVLAAAQHSGAALLPIGARTRHAWWLRSWDRFCIPRPFAGIDVTYGPPLEVPPGKEGIRRTTEELEQALHAVTYGR